MSIKEGEYEADSTVFFLASSQFRKNCTMAKIVYVVFAVLLAATIALAAEEATCSPWLQLCHTTDDCCRHLICSPYQAKCVPKDGLVVPGQDKRPIGPGPFPPGYIS